MGTNQRAPVGGQGAETAYRNTIQDVLSGLNNARKTGPDSWKASCPVPGHGRGRGDQNPSLSISLEDDKVLWHCKAGCSQEDVLAALDLPQPGRNGSRETARWTIRNPSGRAVATHIRYDNQDGSKDVVWERNGTKGLKGLKLRDMPLYGVEKLADLPDKELVVLCEGEKATDAARRAGYNAVGTTCGAEVTPCMEVLHPLDCFSVVIWPDNDAPGRKHMESIAPILSGLGVTPRWVQWADAPPKGDAADTTHEHIQQLVEGATEEMPDRMRALAEDEKPVSYELDAENVTSTVLQVLLPDRHTEGGAGDRFADQHHNGLRYCRAWGVWLHWAGSHWQRDATGEAERRAKDTIMGLYGAASQEQNNDQRGKLVTWARKLDTPHAARAILNWAETDERIAVRPEDLDQDLWALNFTNGTLDLQTGTFREHRQDDLITFCVPHEYDPDALCSTWDAHLEHFLPDPDVRRQVQRDLGLSLTGAQLDEVLSIWYGTGSNAKSTTAEVLRQILGDYATAAAPNLLIAKKHESHPTELADLFGKRMVTSEEVPEGSSLDEAKVKSLTGGGTQKARYSRRDFFSFPRTWSVFLDCNHQPRIRGSDDGIWRRVRIIPWTVSAKGWSGRRPQDEVIASLLAEAPGIVAWMVRGLQDWQEDPTWIAEAVTAATAEYRNEQDRVARFIGECCEVRPAYRVPIGQLYEAYVRWCEEVGDDTLKKRTFGQRLTDMGYRDGKDNDRARTRVRRGLRLMENTSKQPSDQGNHQQVRTHADASSVYPLRETRQGGYTDGLSDVSAESTDKLDGNSALMLSEGIDEHPDHGGLVCVACGRRVPWVSETGFCADCGGAE